MYTYSQLIPIHILLSMVKKAVFEDLSHGMKHCLPVAVLHLRTCQRKAKMHITNRHGADVLGIKLVHDCTGLSKIVVLNVIRLTTQL